MATNITRTDILTVILRENEYGLLRQRNRETGQKYAGSFLSERILPDTPSAFSVSKMLFSCLAGTPYIVKKPETLQPVSMAAAMCATSLTERKCVMTTCTAGCWTIDLTASTMAEKKRSLGSQSKYKNSPNFSDKQNCTLSSADLDWEWKVKHFQSIFSLLWAHFFLCCQVALIYCPFKNVCCS